MYNSPFQYGMRYEIHDKETISKREVHGMVMWRWACRVYVYIVK